MNKLKTISIAAALAVAGITSATAQSTKTNPWDGAYGQLAIGYGVFTPSLGNGVVAAIGGTSTATNVNSVKTGLGNVVGGYNFSIDQNYLIGVGASYYPGASSTANGTLNVITAGGVTASTTVASYNIHNLYNVFLSPGYALDKDRLAYAKLGYTGSTIGISSPTIPYSTINLTGATVGFGYKQMISPTLYAIGEVNYASYSTTTASVTTTSGAVISSVPAKGTGTDFLIGIGYRF